MSDLDYLLIEGMMNVGLVIFAGFALTYCLDLAKIKNENRKLKATNDKYNSAIIKQHKEIERLTAIVKEYRKTLKELTNR